MDDFEQAAWNESQAAASPEPAAVVEETTAADASNTAAAHTPSANEPVIQEPEAVESPEKAEEPATEEAAAEMDAPDASLADETDTQDLLDPIPTPESLATKWNRIPNEAKAEMGNLATIARDYRDDLDKIGGKEGVELFSPIKDFLTTAEPTTENSVNAFAAMFKANQVNTAHMVIDAASHFMRSDEAGFKDVGNAIVRDVFGENVTVERIKGLLQLEEAGLVNLEEDLPSIQAGDSSLFKKQQTELEQLRTQVREQAELIKNPEKIAKQSDVKAEGDFAKDFEAQIDKAILPFLERGRWTDASNLSKYVKSAILADIKADPAYVNAVKHIRQNGGYNGENLPWAVKQSINTLINKSKAQFDLAMRNINQDFKKLTGSSRNAKVKTEVEKDTKAAPISLVTQKQSAFSSSYMSPADAIEEDAYKTSGLRVAS